jgi:ABC-type Fe3+ transport system substrate-binding protein
MPRRRLPFLCLVSLLLAASCSSGGGGDGGEGDGGQSLKGQQVEVAVSWSGTDQERFSAVLDRFKAQTGATVKMRPTADMASELSARLDGGDPPDVALVPRLGLLGALAGRGALRPLPQTTAALVDRNYARVWRDLGTANGKLYGVWFKVANKSTLWFNRDALDRAEGEPPTNWDELQATATRLSEAGIAPVSLGAADGATITDWFENVYLRTAGTNAYIDLARHQLAWDDHSVIEALDTLAQVLRPEWLAGGREGATRTDFAVSVAAALGEPPRAGFVLDANPAAPAATTRFVEFPSIGGSPPSVVVEGDAAVLLTESPAAAALVEFLATPEAAEVWAALGAFTSPNKNVDPGAYRADVDRRAATALLDAEVVRWDMSDLQPPAFGADPGRGLLPLFREYLADPAAAADVASRMEKIAAGTFEP